MVVYPAKRDYLLSFMFKRREGKDNLNEGGTTKGLRLSSLVGEEWRFLLRFYKGYSSSK